MALVKLDATTSTNDFLKELATDPTTKNFTVVTAESQSAGRGQMGSKWTAEVGKNLMMSILIKDCLASVNQLFSLNVAVALAVFETLEKHDIANISIKWPNDIMSGNKKLGGILIENTIKTDQIVSVAGIGLNVNQTNFDGLPKAGSLATISGQEFNRDLIRDEIVDKIIRNVNFIAEHQDVLWQNYLSNLYKMSVPMPFETPDGKRYMAIITGVDRDGKLEIRDDFDQEHRFGLKEIQMLY